MYYLHHFICIYIYIYAIVTICKYILFILEDPVHILLPPGSIPRSPLPNRPHEELHSLCSTFITFPVVLSIHIRLPDKP